MSEMQDLFIEQIDALRAAQKALGDELQQFLEAKPQDRSMLARLQDASDQLSERARRLQEIMFDQNADAALLDEMDHLCEYFEGTADLIAYRRGAGRGLG